jgi:hemolysin activation/secretion protein
VINLPHRNYLLINGFTQLTSSPMPPCETIMSGGASSVRGYTEAIVFEDRGLVVNIEYRWPIPFMGKLCPWVDERVQVVTFFDFGQAWLDKSNSLYVTTAEVSRAKRTQYLEGFTDLGFGLNNRNNLEINAQPTARLYFGVRSNLIRPVYKVRL